MCVRNEAMLTCYRYIWLGKPFCVPNYHSLLAVKVDVEDKSPTWKHLAWILLILNSSIFAYTEADGSPQASEMNFLMTGNASPVLTRAVEVIQHQFAHHWHPPRRDLFLCLAGEQSCSVLSPPGSGVSSGCLHSNGWMWKIFFFFAVDTGTALLLLVSGVCLWGSHLLATARPETTGVQTGWLLILWLWTISCSFVLWEMGNPA